MYISKNEKLMSHVIMYNKFSTGGVLITNKYNEIVYLGGTVEGADLYLQKTEIKSSGLAIYMYNNPDLVELNYLYDRGISDIYYFKHSDKDGTIDFMDKKHIMTIQITSKRLRNVDSWRL